METRSGRGNQHCQGRLEMRLNIIENLFMTVVWLALIMLMIVCAMP